MIHTQTLEEHHLAASWVTIGSFDGIHLGHQGILRSLAEGAHQAGSPAVMITFFPHPSVVLRGQKSPLYLSTPVEKARLAGELGIDHVITLEFTRQLAGLPAYDFVMNLRNSLDMRQLWVGYNFALGRNREGDIPTLQRLGQVAGFELEVFSPVEMDGEVISSSLVRSTLASGDVERAARLLGRCYTVEGKVVPGDGRGRLIGVPTANLDYWPEKVLPANGVYAGWCWHGDKRCPAAANVGIRPTFETKDPQPRLEVHILDINSDLYGKTLTFEFLKRLRGEEKFASVDALVEQMKADIAITRQLTSENGKGRLSFFGPGKDPIKVKPGCVGDLT